MPSAMAAARRALSVALISRSLLLSGITNEITRGPRSRPVIGKSTSGLDRSRRGRRRRPRLLGLSRGRDHRIEGALHVLVRGGPRAHADPHRRPSLPDRAAAPARPLLLDG